jgi:hypothetical protein
MIKKSGNSSLIALMALWTIPSSEYASEPTSSFFSGIPNKIAPGIRNLSTSSTLHLVHFLNDLIDGELKVSDHGRNRDFHPLSRADE